jgi:hypothetical protein
MSHPSRLAGFAVFALVALFCLPIRAAKSSYTIASFAKYVQIPGATPVGPERCSACHEDVAKDYRHAFHAQQGIDCEQCHGPGSLHIEGGGDVSRIIAFRQRSAEQANGACLSCHARDERVRHSGLQDGFGFRYKVF